MNDITEIEIHQRFLNTRNSLQHLKTATSHRRHTWRSNFPDIEDQFIYDEAAICASKASRRLAGKNQVASIQHAPLIRNRATHTNEVSAIAVRLASHLGLNEKLARAIALGHDIGHVPLGHQGEHYLQEKMKKQFTHEVMGVVVAQHIERSGRGLNLTHATLDGMWRHSGKNASSTMTPEAWIVRFADKIAYLCSDYNDMCKRMGWVCDDELVSAMDWFGVNQRARTFRIMTALCEESASEGNVSFDKTEPATRFEQMRGLMYKEYARVVEQNVARYLDPIYEFLEKSDRIPAWLGIALLTDQEVYHLVSKPGMLNWRDIMHTSLGEIMRDVSTQALYGIDPLDLDLDWKESTLLD